MTFDEWFAEADRIAMRLAHIGLDDIDDYDYIDCYEGGDSPENVAYAALSAAGWDAVLYPHLLTNHYCRCHCRCQGI